MNTNCDRILLGKIGRVRMDDAPLDKVTLFGPLGVME